MNDVPSERGNTAYTNLLADVAGRCGTAPLMAEPERAPARAVAQERAAASA